jgi:hypothetical protein
LTGPVSIDTINQDGNEPPHIRPSHKELTNKIIAARRILVEKGFYPAEPTKLAVDFRALDLYSTEEQMEALHAALDEIKAGN